MCHKYGGKRTAPYARLCYLTGRAGEHVPLTEEQATNFYWGMFHMHGDYAVRSPKRTGNRARGGGKLVHTIWNMNGNGEDVIADNARYLDAQYTIDWELEHVVFQHPKGITESMKERVRSFGLTEWKRDSNS